MVSRPAIATFTRTSSGLSGSRSATAPSAGPTSTGAHIAKTVSAANESEPVRDLTQIPAVSHIAEVPKPETTTPARYRPAVRSRSTLPIAEPAIALSPPP